MTVSDELTLIQRAQSDPQAFATLYDRYVDRIFSYAYRQTGDEALAQDVTSATFEKALRHLRRYRWQGKIFCAWLYRIARNEAIGLHRKQRLLAPLEWARGSSPDSEQTVERRQQADELNRALANLAGKDREVLTLHFFEELSSAEVAEILGCTTNSVYVRLHRAQERLRKELERLAQAGRGRLQGVKNDGEA